MKKLLLAASACALMAGAAAAEDVKIGILIGFTGPIESLTSHMAAAAEAAIAEVNASGKAKNTYSAVRGDSTCTDAAAATAAAERMVTAEGVKGIIGGDCSGVTRAVLTNVAYLPLAGAAACGIPSYATCSLNWADLFAHYFGREPWAPPVSTPT